MPPTVKRQCAVCGGDLDPTMASLGMLSHPACSVSGVLEEVVNPKVVNPFTPTSAKVGPIPLPELAGDLKAEFMTMVRWATEFDPRAQQVSLGPSDLGIECDRRLAYKIAGLRGFNPGDPWAALVGSAIHVRLEDIIRRYAAQHGGTWLIEEKVVVDPRVSGSADLVRAPLVVDIKSTGPDMMTKVMKQGPPWSYKAQINLYAKGLRDAGHQIDHVAFLFVPRSGRLDGFHVWADDYDPQIAKAALDRAYGLAKQLTELNIMDNPHRWEQIPANPSYLCQYCPMFNKHRRAEEGADDKHCPGWNYPKGEK